MKKELHKAFFNIYFIIIVIYGIIIAALHCYYKVSMYYDFKNIYHENIVNNKFDYNPYSQIFTSFSSWIVCDLNNNYSNLLFFLCPLIASIPYSWSYCIDYKSNHYKIACSNNNDLTKFHINKYFAIFISSGMTIVIPLVLNFIFISLFIPSSSPDSVYDIYYGIFSNEFISNLFYKSSIVYVIIYVFISFIFCGLFGCLSYAISIYIKNEFITIISPFLIFIILDYIQEYFYKNNLLTLDISPISFLYANKSHSSNFIIISLELFILFLITFYFSVIKIKSKNKIKFFGWKKK